MYVIIVYDIAVERIDVVRITIKQYLNWIQNSVFEGQISVSDLAELKSKITHIIDVSKDSVFVYTVSNPKWIKKTVIGVEQNNTENII